jgi:ATP-dependent protease ClpP protease subunit
MGLGELGPEGLRVVINSPGGNADEGLAIFDYLRSLNIKITTEVIGCAGSIASVIFMAGDVRKIHPNSTLHPHCPFGGILGATADEGEQYFADVRKVEDRLVGIYSDRSGRAAEGEVIRELLKEDKDMSADEALASKFATIIVQPVKALAKLGHKPGAGAPNPTTQPAGRRSHNPNRMAAHNSKPNAPAGNGRSNISRAAERLLGDVMALLKGEKVKALSVSTGGDAPVEYNISTDDSNEIKSGDPITTAAGDAVPDSTITLADGTVITVVGGLVDTVTVPATNKTDEEKNKETVENNLTDDDKKDGTTAEEIRATLRRERTESTERFAAIEKRLNIVASMQSTGGAPITVDPITNPTSTSQQRQASTATGAADANASSTKEATASAIGARKAQKNAARGGTAGK